MKEKSRIDLEREKKTKRFDEAVKVWIALATILVSVGLREVRDYIGTDFVCIEVILLIITLTLWSVSRLLPEPKNSSRMVTFIFLFFIIGLAFTMFMTSREPTIMEYSAISVISILVGIGAIVYLEK